MPTPDEILDLAYQEAIAAGRNPVTSNEAIINNQVEYICRSTTKAGIRVILACCLAKVDRPEVDIRKPYTEIEGSESYSGRTYDERYITDFITRYRLPANHTTAFLTPVLRNRNETLVLNATFVGRPKRLYEEMLSLLDSVYRQVISAEILLIETIRALVIIRDEHQQRIEAIKSNLQANLDDLPLSSEAIVRIVRQHLEQPRSSRLPVLVVAAIYQTVKEYLNEMIIPLQAHNAADSQTGALGDIQVTLKTDHRIVTCYEMKTRKVTIDDIDHALTKLDTMNYRIDNYLFITTENIDNIVHEYASTLYEVTDGIEIVILDCIGFLRHFLHLFHRHRIDFIDIYQQMVLDEPESAVHYALKEVFLALRLAAENRE